MIINVTIPVEVDDLSDLSGALMRHITGNAVIAVVADPPKKTRKRKTTEPEKEDKPVEPPAEKPTVTREDLLLRLKPWLQEDPTRKDKLADVLAKHNAAKLSDLLPGNYADVLVDVGLIVD